ncbi:putative PEP-binding protein [Cellulomonas sp. C5510]|uniref:putative PEP-binding protein n=1 Tax=Cellulomonas sp. C5510 TaxID=2871170 RepID=UPI00210817FD|nr:putative PEP-binding protein [Cellulomonas sp. C5510]
MTTTLRDADRVLRGVGVGRGAAVGPVVRVHPAPALPPAEPAVADPAAAVTAALDAVARDLDALAESADGTLREVLRATAAMADDEMLRTEALRRVAGGTAPARAVDEAVEEVCATFTAAGGYLAERVTDLRSVRHRVVARLLGLPAPGVPLLTEPSVVVAEDLAPADTAGLDPRLVLAIVTEQGGPTGHTAIIAGQLGLPCVVRAPGASVLEDGDRVAVDAAAGVVHRDPGPALRKQLAGRAADLRSLAEDTAPGATADGHPVALLANIGTAEDARALPPGAEGVGLFRTEVLFLSRAVAPAVEEQADVYAAVLASLGDRKVVVRTLDAGADKPLPFAGLPPEENPALGVRGYRLARRRPELLDDQLRALALAARRTGTEPWVMAPMVATPAEASAFAARARGAGLSTVGAMVEVPSAAWSASALLADLDFVSIGTNDLAQYTMAADRLQGDLTDLLDPWQPAVLGLVERTVTAARAAGRPVGICGESAADPVMALVLVGLGVTSLSMSASSLPAVRFSLRQHSRATCTEIARAALASPDAHGARAAASARVAPEVRRTLALPEQG